MIWFCFYGTVVTRRGKEETTASGAEQTGGRPLSQKTNGSHEPTIDGNGRIGGQEALNAQWNRSSSQTEGGIGVRLRGAQMQNEC